MFLIYLILTACLSQLMTSKSESMSVKQVSVPFEHSEGPHWDEEEHALYFVDIAGFAVHRYEPKINTHTSLKLNDTIGVVVPVEGVNGRFIIGLGKTVTVLDWGRSNEYTLRMISTVDKDKVGNRFNDGKVDRNGNFWIGTMGEEKPIGNVKMNQGSLYKLDTNCDISKKISPVSISNGIAWNSENTIMYYIDSPTRRVDAFDYNEETAEISNRRVFFDFQKSGVQGVPDGMTIDIENNLWIACWGGSKVIQVCGENGKLLRSIDLPVERVTSVAFGGEDLTTLYVTTMRTGLTPEQLKKQPLAGALFAITGLDATGTIGNKARLSCLD